MSARIGPVEVAIIRDAIAPLDTADNRAAYREGRFPRAEQCRDVNLRYRWDLFWAACRAVPSLYDVVNAYRDAHVDTALRAIVAPL